MAEREPRPEPYARVPEELQRYEQWVIWRMDDNNRKIPVNPHTLGNAGVRWPSTWASFDVVLETGSNLVHGIGFVPAIESIALPRGAIPALVKPQHMAGQQGHAERHCRRSTPFSTNTPQQHIRTVGEVDHRRRTY